MWILFLEVLMEKYGKIIASCNNSATGTLNTAKN